jgi:hypothetical protein
MITSLDIDIEMDMIDAVCCATKDISCMNLYLRNHPFAPLNEYASFQPFKDHISITQGTLDEDLQNADLVMFSYSTVAEEAIIKGVPVWQWRSVNYNGSVFRDIKLIPCFYKVSDLKKALDKFIIDPLPFMPSEGTKKIVSKKCFYKVDGKSSERIANELINMIQE